MRNEKNSNQHRRKALRISRRSVILSGTLSSLGAGSALGRGLEPATGSSRIVLPNRKPRIGVIGAGAFGGWTALQLARSGAEVTLVDAWGPGNSRASSGGETRVIRAGYGPDRVYTEMAARSLRLWIEAEKDWGETTFFPGGALWMGRIRGDFEAASVRFLREAGLQADELSPDEASRRFPQVNFDGISWVMLEKEAGCLLARRACQMVHRSFVKVGGSYRQAAAARPVPDSYGILDRLSLSDGSALRADQYVFACGPWMSRLFPDLLGDQIRPTRQEVFYFGTPAGDEWFTEQKLPAWIDLGDPLYYGIPGNEWRGFKIADDTEGPTFDPTDGDRTLSQKGIESARQYLTHRFPGMQGAPLLEGRVCQYERSPDSHFVLDRHPAMANVWLVGGGSGHGFKHGPALGEKAANMILGRKDVDPFFSLRRFRRND